MPSSPKSYKCFPGHVLKAADLDPILPVTSHPVKICALRAFAIFLFLTSLVTGKLVYVSGLHAFQISPKFC